MDAADFPFSLPLIGVLIAFMTAVQLAWYIAVIVFLYKIWMRVRHLPS